MIWHGIIRGRPVTKKNSGQIIFIRKNGKRKPVIIPSAAYRMYEESASWQLKPWQPAKPIQRPVKLKAMYYMENRVGWPDLVGLLQCTCDVLEKAEVLDNDRWVILMDGSRIAGIDKQNPRVEITLEEVGPEDVSYQLDPKLRKRGTV